MITKHATIKDAEEILNLQKLGYISEAEIYNDCTIPALTQTLGDLWADFEDQVFLKASAGGKIIVHPDFQNRGTGTRLMNEIERFFGEARRFESFTGHGSRAQHQSLSESFTRALVKHPRRSACAFIPCLISLSNRHRAQKRFIHPSTIAFLIN